NAIADTRAARSKSHFGAREATSFARKRRISLRRESFASILLTDTDYDYVRSPFLRCEIRRERRPARVRRRLRLDRRDARLQFCPNRARVVGKPRLYSGD